MKIQATITYDLDRAWEVWAVNVDVPDTFGELTAEDQKAFIKNHPEAIEFVEMEDSGNTTMTIDEVVIT